MKKFSRNSALLAASVTALLSSTVANAAVDLDLGTGSQVFAKEISIESSPTLSPTTIQGTVGFGFSSGANFYVRYDLDNGAKFGTALSLTSLVSWVSLVRVLPFLPLLWLRVAQQLMAMRSLILLLEQLGFLLHHFLL
jgi:hypothetical protein